MKSNDNFIIAIQNAYDQYRSCNNTDNKLNYYGNVAIIVNDIDESCFEIKHYRELRTGDPRTQFLYCRNGVRIYFTDVDIIMMLLQIKNSEKRCQVLRVLSGWLKGETEKGVLTIDNIDYSFPGLYWKSDDVQFENMQDILVPEKDLIALINLIIAKDIAATNIIKEKYIFAIRTVKKYYTLLKWYWFKDQHAKEQLDLIGYNSKTTLKNNYNYSKRRNYKKMDLAFQKVSIE